MLNGVQHRFEFRRDAALRSAWQRARWAIAGVIVTGAPGWLAVSCSLQWVTRFLFAWV